MNRTTLIPLIVIGLSCSENAESNRRDSRLRELSADSLFYAVEQMLLETDSNLIRFHITADGPLTADLRGDLVLLAGNRAMLNATGTFGPDSARLHLESDGSTMHFGNGVDLDGETPRELNRALVIGMTRMGLLHSLARLVENTPPDHADGGVTDWVQVRDLSRMNPMDAALGVEFAIVVDGERVGAATLNVDAETGETIVRRQTVQFPDGEMRVIERYGG